MVNYAFPTCTVSRDTKKYDGISLFKNEKVNTITTTWRKKLLDVLTLKEETFAGRNFRGFAVFCPFRESFFREIFQNGSSAKVFFPRNVPKWVVRESFFQKIICLFYIFF